MKSRLLCALGLVALSTLVFAETKKDQMETVTVKGKTITIKYSSPAVNGRVGKLFGKDGQIGSDATYPVWRAGANDATALHTDADLAIGSLAVPKGDYTLYVDVSNPDAWELIVDKETGQSGMTFDAKQVLGRVKMTMSKPAAMVEQLKYTLSPNKLQLAWENHVASVPLTVK